MKARVLEETGKPLREVERSIPEPGAGQVLLKVETCAVCRTDLHPIDAELPDIPLPIVPGHEIIGRIVRCGPGASFATGTRLGVPWPGYTAAANANTAAAAKKTCVIRPASPAIRSTAATSNTPLPTTATASPSIPTTLRTKPLGR